MNKPIPALSVTKRDWLTYFAQFQVVDNWRGLRCIQLKMVAEWEIAPTGDDWHEISNSDYYRLLGFLNSGSLIEGNRIDGLLPRTKGNWVRRQIKDS